MTDADLAAIEQKLSDRIITLVLGLGANDNAVAGWHQHTVDEARAVIMAALRSLPRESGRVGGSFAFRTRCSELRRPPFNMTIENKVERHSRDEGGTVKHWSETYYRYVPPAPARDLLEIAERGAEA